MRVYSTWHWHLDEMFLKINIGRHYLRRAVENEGERVESTSWISVTIAASEIRNPILA